MKSSHENKNHQPTYQGNRIPLVIKFAWIILIIWVVVYLIVYAFPDLKEWLIK